MKVYDQTDKVIHQLCQIIAKANRTYVPKEEDDSHTNLFFDPISGSIYGRWINTDEGKIVLTLNLEDLQFEWLDEHFFVQRGYEVIGQSTAQIEKAIAADLDDLGLKPEGFRAELHFDIPDYDFAEKAFAPIEEEALVLWQEYRELGNTACAAILGHLQADGETRIWPHHFDTAIYVEPTEERGIGFGLAMQDNMLHAPYFYLAGYALNEEEFDYSQINDLQSGQWLIKEDWKGAALSLEVLSELSPQERLLAIYQFIDGALSFYLA